jgi:hypothetical protein
MTDICTYKSIIQIKRNSMTQKSKVAVIGLGNIGTAVAANFVESNRSVIVADRKIEKATALSQKLGNLVQPM